MGKNIRLVVFNVGRWDIVMDFSHTGKTWFKRQWRFHRNDGDITAEQNSGFEFLNHEESWLDIRLSDLQKPTSFPPMETQWHQDNSPQKELIRQLSMKISSWTYQRMCFYVNGSSQFDDRFRNQSFLKIKWVWVKMMDWTVFVIVFHLHMLVLVRE